MTFFSSARWWMLCSAVSVISAVVNSAPNISPDEHKAEEYLRQFGYLEVFPEGRSARDPVNTHRSRRDKISHSIKKFQRFVGLPVSGKLDNRTVEAMDRPRCGVPDIRVMPKDAVGFRWSKRRLTWRLGSNPPQLSRGRTRQAIQEAFDVWSRVIPLDFSEVSSSSKADFTIEFARYSHGDPWPFDGPGRILAHAMFPPDGRTHFDSDESWAYRDEKLRQAWQHTDLLAVAIHELGHALGLGHSRTSDSIMAPFYKHTDSSRGYETPKLHPDDLYRIQRLYGKRITKARTVPPSPRTTSTTERPRTTTRRPYVRTPSPKPRVEPPVMIPDEPATENCPTTITAATNALNGKTYVFSGSRMWEFDEERKRIGRMKGVSEMFSPGPSSVTAAVTNPRTHYTLLLHNRRLWAYLWNANTSKFDLHRDYPKTLSDKVTFVPSGAFIWADGNMVLINGNNFVTYDPNWNVPTMINLARNYFPNFPRAVSGAAPTDKNSLLLFSTTKAHLYDLDTKSLVNENGVNLRILFKC